MLSPALASAISMPHEFRELGRAALFNSNSVPPVQPILGLLCLSRVTLRH